MSFLIQKFMRDETGATAIEYGLIAALISVVLITVLTSVGQELINIFTQIQAAMAN